MAVVNATSAEPAVSAERRHSPRRRLCLDVGISGESGEAFEAVMHELSRTGFLIEAQASVVPGELLKFSLPETGTISALVIWCCGRHFGCQFQRPLATATVSAAMLNARPMRSAETLPQRILLEELEPTGSQHPIAPAAPGLRSAGVIAIVSLGFWIAIAVAIVSAYP